MHRNSSTLPTPLMILWVDDDASCLELRRLILERQGYRAVDLERPSEALKQDLARFDLILVDYEMPDINGRDLLIKLRAAHVACPVILVSGCAGELPWETKVSFSACVQKGPPTTELLGLIWRYLKQATIPDLE